MKKLKLNKLSVAKLNGLQYIKGGAKEDNTSTHPNCDPTHTDTKTLEDPDLPKTGV